MKYLLKKDFGCGTKNCINKSWLKIYLFVNSPINTLLFQKMWEISLLLFTSTLFLMIASLGGLYAYHSEFVKSSSKNHQFFVENWRRF